MKELIKVLKDLVREIRLLREGGWAIEAYQTMVGIPYSYNVGWYAPNPETVYVKYDEENNHVIDDHVLLYREQAELLNAHMEALQVKFIRKEDFENG